MVLPVKVNLPEQLRVSRVVLLSGLLTFLYLVEMCLGVRTVYSAFSLWHARRATLVACTACLLVAVFSYLAVNLTSALWDTKAGVVRSVLHVLVGAPVWRYVALWTGEERQERQALLLAMAKFLFSQVFTVPLAVAHASLLERLDAYVIGSAACVSVNLVLTCAVFARCQPQVKELRQSDRETIGLVPLIFCQEAEEPEKRPEETAPESGLEILVLRFMVFFQTFGFTFGRLLALGVLFKLAGVYAISIMFLQLLISVVYLKFQVPFLVSDSLPKWRQLARLAFMSYVLIFEWQLNRDPKTGYDSTSNIRHSVLYYTMATAESVFYFVAWAVADIYSEGATRARHRLVKSVIIAGTMSLVFSLIMYFFLALWHSRRLSSLMRSVRRRYASSKLKVANSILKKGDSEKSKSSKIDISNPIQDENDNSKDESNLEKHSSYKDLREPLDDEIEIYVGKNTKVSEFQTVSKCINEETDVKSMKTEKRADSPCLPTAESMTNLDEKSNTQEDESEADKNLTIISNKTSTRSCKIDTESGKPDTEVTISTSTKLEASTETVSKEQSADPQTSIPSPEKTPSPDQPKSKIALLSESLGEGWSKFKRFTGTVKDQFQKGKGDTGKAEEDEGSRHQSEVTASPTAETEEATDHAEGSASETCGENESVVDMHGADCPCFACQPSTQLRRRSSSVPPPADRRSWLESQMLASSSSSPASPVLEVRRAVLARIALEERIEHYV